MDRFLNHHNSIGYYPCKHIWLILNALSKFLCSKAWHAFSTLAFFISNYVSPLHLEPSLFFLSLLSSSAEMDHLKSSSCFKGLRETIFIELSGLESTCFIGVEQECYSFSISNLKTTHFEKGCAKSVTGQPLCCWPELTQLLSLVTNRMSSVG